MPGKVNPVIPEMVNQVAFAVLGTDLTVTLAAEAGQLQLNAFEPIICHSLLQSIGWMDKAFDTLRTHCVEGIEVNREHLLGVSARERRDGDRAHPGARLRAGQRTRCDGTRRRRRRARAGAFHRRHRL